LNVRLHAVTSVLGQNLDGLEEGTGVSPDEAGSG